MAGKSDQFELRATRRHVQGPLDQPRRDPVPRGGFGGVAAESVTAETSLSRCRRVERARIGTSTVASKNVPGGHSDPSQKYRCLDQLTFTGPPTVMSRIRCRRCECRLAPITTQSGLRIRGCSRPGSCAGRSPEARLREHGNQPGSRWRWQRRAPGTKLGQGFQHGGRRRSRREPCGRGVEERLTVSRPPPPSPPSRPPSTRSATGPGRST